MIKAKAKGIRFERKIVNEAKAKGLIAFRSAASLSPIDCVTIDVKAREVTFIQAKKGKSGLTKAQKKEFEDMSGKYTVKFQEISE